MPVISPTRYSTTVSSSSYLPPSIGGTTSSLAKSSNYGSPSSYHTSSYRSNSLGSSGYSSGGYSSSYLRASYRSNLSSSPSIYRTSSYLTGGNNDTTATSRFGVSSNRFLRASSDRDTLKLATGKTQYNSNTVNTSRSKALQSKPPIGASSPSIRHQRTSSDSARSRDNSLTRVTSKSDPNSNCINNNDTSELNDQPKSKISSSLSSSSLARQVATSGLELYEKYSPAHYIPKCELSRSRSLSEATSSSNKNSNNDKGLSNSSSNVHQLLQTTRESKQHRQQNQNENDLQNLNIKSSSPPSSSHQTSSPTSAKDISKVRNASIRSALPASPTPSRYYDREGRSSALAAGRSYDTEDPSTSKSSLNSSNSYDRTAAEGLCGLRNIGNTCYMNSVIQCLSHTRELTKFLKSQVGIKSSSKDQQILLEFAKLIREMWSPNVRSVTPLELKSAFSSKHRMYSGYNQQDAQEFLRFFLDSLHCALNAGVKGEQLKIDDSLSDNKKADLTWEWYCKVENSVIRDLFVGQLKSTLKCTTCGNTSVTFDPFWDLSVSLPSSSRCKLDACLDLFIREEILDGDEMPTCSKCQARRKCTKSFTIQRFPKYLAIHLKRFSETRWSKLSNVVEFPTGERELNMAPYASNTNVSATYSLYGIANHMGSTAGGHYVALCKHPVTKKWHEFNDNVVSDDLSESVLVSSSAYLLFYERA